jgi:hypothetical protein
VFFNVADAREKIEHWRSDYNQNRPHSALGDRTPAEFVSALESRPFVFPIVDKAKPQPRQGFAGAGQKPPALDTVAALPSEPDKKTKDLAESPGLIERFN